MSEAKFTPGPWKVGSDFVGPLWVRQIGQNWSVAQVGHEDFDTCRANAALIAAAPELYEQLERAERLYSSRDLIANSTECGEWINATRATLAKARRE